MLGKTRRPEMRVILDDYVKRIGPIVPSKSPKFGDGAAAVKKNLRPTAPRPGPADAGGRNLDSKRGLAKWSAKLPTGAPAKSFFSAADADGFPDALRPARSQKLLSVP